MAVKTQYQPSSPTRVAAALAKVRTALVGERGEPREPREPEDLPEAPALADLPDEDGVTATLLK